MRRSLPRTHHNHHGGDPINFVNDCAADHHRRDLYNACYDIDLDAHKRADYLERVRAVYRAAAVVLNDYDPGYTVNLGPLDQLAAPINPATIRVNIDGTTYHLTPATGDTLTDDPRPHSRACGMRRHPHGPECHTNCPTCGGRTE